MSLGFLKSAPFVLAPIFIAVAFSGDPCERHGFDAAAAALLLASVSLGAAAFLILRDLVNVRRTLLVLTIAMGIALGAGFLMLVISVWRFAGECSS